MRKNSRSLDNLAVEIAAFAAGTSLKGIRGTVVETAKLHAFDGFATMLAGSVEAAARKMRRQLLSMGHRPEATVIGTKLKLPAQQAALANGLQAHVLDYDDAQYATLPSRPFGQQTHPTAPVLAASLALAEKLKSRGSEFLAAYIVGVEVACRLGDAIDPSHYLNGFHPTGTMGTFGATAACCHLLKLRPEEIRRALGIAGSLASGVRANRGTMAKALNAGRAAENGVLAATLAERGFTASAKIFDDPMGYFSAACGKKVDKRLLRFGDPFFFEKPGVAIKLYPCPVVMHPMVDGLLYLTKRYDIRPEQVAKINIAMSSEAALPLVYDRPKDGLQGKFSLPFTAAVAITQRQAGLDEFTDEKLRDPRVRSLMRRVEIVRRSARRSGKNEPGTEVEILSKDGESYRRKAAGLRGRPLAPTSRRDAEDKFRQCAGRALKPTATAAFVERFWSMERVSSISTWLRPLRTPRR
ncbi:MAG: MmgE/PrpD family protein [Candidatus Binatia bacterium]